MKERKPSMRFKTSKWAERVIPLAFGILALLLLATLVVVALTVLGFLPGVFR